MNLMNNSLGLIQAYLPKHIRRQELSHNFTYIHIKLNVLYNFKLSLSITNLIFIYDSKFTRFRLLLMYPCNFLLIINIFLTFYQ